MEKLNEKLKLLPDSVGVYLMKDGRGHVIYIGKALSLRKRVRSYFAVSNRGPKTRVLAEAIRDLDYIVTDSQAEALILECNLIKKHRPRYNVRLRDDKKYPYVKIGGDSFPAFSLTRNLKKDNSRYYGPYVSAGALRRTLKLMRKLFMLRSCRRDMSKPSRPCLYYHLGQCIAPCTGKVTRKDYEKLVQSAALFLEGRARELIGRLKKEMKKESDSLHFEKAVVLRGRIEGLEKIFEEQKMVSKNEENEDYIAYALEGSIACIGLFPMREGKVLGQEQFFLEGVEHSTPSEILSSFVKQYYLNSPFIPRNMILASDIDDKSSIEQFLRKKSGDIIHISVPKRGRRREIIRRLESNSMLKLKEFETFHRKGMRKEAVGNLREVLGLKVIPSRIEAFDISQTGGAEPVGSVVVFGEGEPRNKDYRHFRIKSSPGDDDCAMMAEIVERRYARRLKEKKEFPDLILVDGGPGQLHSAVKALKGLNIEGVPVIGLAKQFEHIFLPGAVEPVKLPSNSPALQLLRHIRDEAHRFATTFHRRIRRKKLRESILDEIPGLGKNRKRLLLSHFGSVEAIARADRRELEKLDGIGPQLAKRILLSAHGRCFS